MKTFDKRKVPGLENFSSDSDNDDEIPFKKSCNNDDFEIELEVEDNEFLQEELMETVNKIPKSTNPVWENTVQETLLDESLNKVTVNHMHVQRNVESYNVDREDRNALKRKRITPRVSNNYRINCEPKFRDVRDRIGIHSTSITKDRNYIHINPRFDPREAVVLKIARNLREPKIELIDTCYNALGREKCLEFYYMTEDIEENGGLLVVNGSRRRTSGGVFLTLIKESTHIDDNIKRLIFPFDFYTPKVPIVRPLMNVCVPPPPLHPPPPPPPLPPLPPLPPHYYPLINTTPPIQRSNTLNGYSVVGAKQAESPWLEEEIDNVKEENKMDESVELCEVKKEKFEDLDKVVQEDADVVKVENIGELYEVMKEYFGEIDEDIQKEVKEVDEDKVEGTAELDEIKEEELEITEEDIAELYAVKEELHVNEEDIEDLEEELEEDIEDIKEEELEVNEEDREELEEELEEVDEEDREELEVNKEDVEEINEEDTEELGEEIEEIDEEELEEGEII